MKKFFSILLALAMVLSLGVAAFADGFRWYYNDGSLDSNTLALVDSVDNRSEMEALVASLTFDNPDDSEELKQAVRDAFWAQYNSTVHPGDVATASEVVDDGGGKDLAYRGPALNQSKKPDEKKTVKLTVNGVEVPIQLIDITNADTLPAEEKAAFLKAFEEVRKITDKVVKYFFWLMPAGAGTPGEFEFSCEGTGVEVTVNGNQMAVVSEGGENYIATLTEYGALAIMCDA